MLEKRIPVSSFSPVVTLEQDAPWQLCPILVVGPVVDEGDWAAKRYADEVGQALGVQDIESIVSFVSEMMATGDGVADAARRWKALLERTKGRCLVADRFFNSFLVLEAGHRDIDRLVRIASSRAILSQVVDGERVGVGLTSALDEAQGQQRLAHLGTSQLTGFADIVDGKAIPATIPAFHVRFHDDYATFHLVADRDKAASKYMAPRETGVETTIEDAVVVDFLVRASFPAEVEHPSPSDWRGLVHLGQHGTSTIGGSNLPKDAGPRSAAPIADLTTG